MGSRRRLLDPNSSLTTDYKHNSTIAYRSMSSPKYDKCNNTHRFVPGRTVGPTGILIIYDSSIRTYR